MSTGTAKISSEQSSPVCTGSTRSGNGNYVNTIEGGFNKLEEAALRCLQGIMPMAFNGSKWMNERYACTAAFAYAKEFLKLAEEKRVEAENEQSAADLKRDLACEAPQADQPKPSLILPSS